jgi:hypothetical protein
MSILSGTDCGTLKKCIRTSLGNAALTSTRTEIDASDDIPNGSKAVLLEIHWKRSAGSHIIKLNNEDSASDAEDVLFDYEGTDYISRLSCCRVNSSRKLWIWVDPGTNTQTYIYLIGYYR